MSDIGRKLIEDRALRDAAKSIVTAQYSQVKTGLSGEAIGEHVADLIGDDLLELADQAGDIAKENRGILALAAAAVALWFARKPILSLLDRVEDPEVDSSEQEVAIEDGPSSVKLRGPSDDQGSGDGQ